MEDVLDVEESKESVLASVVSVSDDAGRTGRGIRIT
jgi:hypothetical protein